jgi:DNA uptake protein ComE-like DNA-binding protein
LAPAVALDRLTSATRSARQDARSTRTVAASSLKGLDLGKLMPVAGRSETTGTTTTIPKVSLPVSLAGAQGAAPAAIRPAAVPVNRAEAREIMEKLKIDARRARLIVEFRKMYGRFRRPEDLGQVTGITDEMVRRWEGQDLLEFN